MKLKQAHDRQFIKIGEMTITVLLPNFIESKFNEDIEKNIIDAVLMDLHRNTMEAKLSSYLKFEYVRSERGCLDVTVAVIAAVGASYKFVKDYIKLVEGAKAIRKDMGQLIIYFKGKKIGLGNLPSTDEFKGEEEVNEALKQLEERGNRRTKKITKD
ncbi:hypothetical protein [Pseudoalteromonas sp. bablab_jr004]|uniref:hypothetical protein n=1 Tax=Pseudoalteromonas sp. bablab_jr004 TaxID=2755065 RepID=UPI0018F739E4|nr:hypothetical protein [Pseudoalteromonas sp. bablab_jr004]